MSAAASPVGTPARNTARWFVPGDLDGFFGLFFSGFPDLLLIAGLAPLCGFPMELVAGRILPAVAFSILFGNLFYAWQAHRLSEKTGRADVTAIPFGVNTPTIFAYVFLIMLPAYLRTHDSQLAWHLGVFACFVSGIVQTAGAFCTDWLRRHTPRAALLCPLAGIAIAFLCLGFVLQIFQTPELALLPTVIILAVYGSRIRLPYRMPGGLLCIVAGVILVALLRAFHFYHLAAPPPGMSVGLYLPRPVNLFEFLRHGEGWQYLSIILPMSALDTIVSLQILESVKVAGDDYPTWPSLLVNGLATLGAAAFGSPFPTTLYFGHLAHKAYGARVGYSILNGATTLLICVTGLISPIMRFVPLEVVAIVIVWFGLVMVAQAFQEVPKSHCIAVAFGLLPMLAAWGLQLVDLALRKGGSSLAQAAPSFGDELAIYGLIALSQGALLISMIWAAAIAYMLDRRFLHAAGWMLAGALLSCLGLIHAFNLSPAGIVNKLGILAAPEFAASYATGALFLAGCHFYNRRCPSPEENSESV
ncbi:MAG: NCS2 family permease [Acidobacteriia bacterium]|nr:NCS2 family permease [Terriglobia bacterium]